MMKKILITLLLFCVHLEAMNQKKEEAIIKKENRYTQKYDLENLHIALKNAHRLLLKTQEDLNKIAPDLPYDIKAYQQYKQLLRREKRLEIIKTAIECAIYMKKSKIQKIMSKVILT